MSQPLTNGREQRRCLQWHWCPHSALFADQKPLESHKALSSSGVYNWTHPQPGTREHQVALAQYSQTGNIFPSSMFSEKNLILLRQTCKLKLKARVYTMLSKYNTAKSSLNLKALLSFQNLSQFQSLELIHIFQRTNGRTIHPLPAPVLIMTLSCVAQQILFICC